MKTKPLLDIKELLPEHAELLKSKGVLTVQDFLAINQDEGVDIALCKILNIGLDEYQKLISKAERLTSDNPPIFNYKGK